MTSPDTLKKSIEEYVAALYTERSPKTAKTYSYGLKLFCRSVGGDDPPFSSLTMEHFIKFPAWLSKQGYKKSTKGIYNSATGTYLDWLTIQGKIDPKHVELLRYRKASSSMMRIRESTLPKTPSPETIEKILESVRSSKTKSPIRERDLALIGFLVSTGCRADEARRLKVRDVDLANGRAKVTGKGNKERYVFLNQDAINALISYWDVRGFCENNHPAFAGHSYGYGKRASYHISTKTIWLIVKTLAKRAGIDSNFFSPHSFRHAFATKMLRETGNLALVQDMMGHASPQSTRVYAKITVDDLQEAHRMVYRQ